MYFGFFRLKEKIVFEENGRLLQEILKFILSTVKRLLVPNPVA